MNIGYMIISYIHIYTIYSQVNAERKTFKIANNGHLQLHGRQNTTTAVSLC